VPPALENVTLRLDVENVFDATYVARGSDADGSVGRALPLYSPGRRMMPTATVRF